MQLQVLNGDICEDIAFLFSIMLHVIHAASAVVHFWKGNKSHYVNGKW